MNAVIDYSRKKLCKHHLIMSEAEYRDLPTSKVEELLVKAFWYGVANDKGKGFRISMNFGEQKHIDATHIHIMLPEKDEVLPRQ